MSGRNTREHKVHILCSSGPSVLGSFLLDDTNINTPRKLVAVAVRSDATPARSWFFVPGHYQCVLLSSS